MQNITSCMMFWILQIHFKMSAAVSNRKCLTSHQIDHECCYRSVL